MKTALFPGTFDPPTLGHLDIISRAASICDKLYVGIAVNTLKTKQGLFSVAEKKEMLRTITQSLSYVEVVDFSGLLVDFAKQNQIDCIVRGVRAFSDFEYECRMALANRMLGSIETVFLMADERLSHISSTLIRELGRYKTRLHAFIPASIEPQVFEKLSHCRV